MRFTQLGHQVPRRNSITNGPCSTKCFKETAWGRFAASNINSGARSPTCNVLLSFAIDRTVKHPRKADNTGRNRGIKRDSSQRDDVGEWVSERLVRRLSLRESCASTGECPSASVRTRWWGANRCHARVFHSCRNKWLVLPFAFLRDPAQP